MENKEQFIDFWRKYIELRFLNEKFLRKQTLLIPSYRTNFFIENFSIDKKLPIGTLGHESVIVAYDALAYSQSKWEQLVIYSMIHAGDSDSTGCIAASWFGSLYGFHKIPKSNYAYNEYKNELIGIGNDIYKKEISKKK
jgi:hypothetical protein